MCKLLGYASNDLVRFWLRPRCYLVCLCMFQVWPPGIQCQICHKTFSDQSTICADYDTAHAQSNTRAPPPPRPEHPDARHKCDVCGRKFTTKSNLRHHLKNVHNPDGPRYECEVCGKRFTQKGSLGLHLETVHSADGSSHECEVCPRKFKQKSGLTFHRRTVHGVDVVHFPV